MIDMKMERPQVSLDTFKPLLPVVAVVCALLAAWLGWNAWQQHRDDARHGAIEQSRDAATARTIVSDASTVLHSA